jgi:hypothetical protein
VMIVSMRKFSEWITRCDLMRPEVIGFETVVIDFHLSRMAAAKLRKHRGRPMWVFPLLKKWSGSASRGRDRA